MDMRKWFLSLIAVVAGSAMAHAEVEKPSVIDGTAANYAVIAPTFQSVKGVGSDSYIRLFNGGTTSSTFTVTTVGVPSGATYGNSNTISIPANASVQFSLGQILNLTGAGSLSGSDTSFAVYLRNSDSAAGYQHVTYSGESGLFENVSTCSTSINEQLLSSRGALALTNLHTSKGNASIILPSSVRIHNYGSTAKTYKVNVYNAGSVTLGGVSGNSGKLTCQFNTASVPANSSITIPMSTIETTAGCTLDSDEAYANILVSDSAGGAPNAVVSHLLYATAYKGDVNMTPVCAVNKVATTQAAPSVPTAYCGSVNIASPCGTMAVNLIISVAPNNRARSVITGETNGCYVYGAGVGSVSGSTFSITSLVDGSVTSGSISNGTISTTTTNPFYGTPISGSASTANCY
jgi:hypothetical protein